MGEHERAAVQLADPAVKRLVLAAALALAPAALAQEAPSPRTDVAALKKEAKADPGIKAALADPSRTMDHRLRDKERRVELILRAAGVKPGARVLDVASGGGYLALLLASMAGETGHVDLHNTPGWIAQFPSMDPERQKTWMKHANIGWIVAPWNDLNGPGGSYDVIVLGQIYHDVVLEGGDYLGMGERLFAMLKPGGRLVVEDHDALPEMPLEEQAYLHRISHGDVTGHFLRAGFVAKEMVLIDTPEDDRKFNVFWPTVRGRTDRFVAVFEKPAR